MVTWEIEQGANKGLVMMGRWLIDCVFMKEKRDKRILISNRVFFRENKKTVAIVFSW